MIRPLDVSGDGQIVPLDALVVVNELNERRHSDDAGRLLAPVTTPPVAYLDVNGDGYCTALDALLVINHLNESTASLMAVDQALLDLTDSIASAYLNTALWPVASPPPERPWIVKVADPRASVGVPAKNTVGACATRPLSTAARANSPS